MAFSGPNGKLLFENKTAQLVLLNDEVEFFRNRGGYGYNGRVKYPFLKFDSWKGYPIYAEDVTWLNMKDEVARKLISDLFQTQDESSMATVKLFWESHPSKYKLKIKYVDYYNGDHYGKGNIFKCLHDRFHDNVKISVGITLPVKCSDEEDSGGIQKYHATCTTEEMPIAPCPDYRCEGSITLLPPFEDGDESGYSMGFKAQLNVTAHITVPDVEIFAANQFSLCKKIYEQAQFYDVEICTKDGVKVGAHKNFLCAISPVFEAQFGGHWNDEKLPSAPTSKLDMTDMSEEGVRAFLRYVYYQDLQEANMDPKVAYELLSIAHKYNIPHLEKWAIAHFLERKSEDLSVELAFAIYSLVSNIKDAAKLKSKTAYILVSHTPKMKNLPQYKEMLEEDPEHENKFRCRIFRDIFP